MVFALCWPSPDFNLLPICPWLLPHIPVSISLFQVGHTRYGSLEIVTDNYGKERKSDYPKGGH